MSFQFNNEDYNNLLEPNQSIKLILSFSYSESFYHLFQIGGTISIGKNKHHYFPNVYLVDSKTKIPIFMTNEMKFGVNDAKIDENVGEVHIYGYFWGQSNQWDRYRIVDPCYLGYIEDDGSYTDVSFDDE